jgi:hypothetical protein
VQRVGRRGKGGWLWRCKPVLSLQGETACGMDSSYRARRSHEDGDAPARTHFSRAVGRRERLHCSSLGESSTFARHSGSWAGERQCKAVTHWTALSLPPLSHSIRRRSSQRPWRLSQMEFMCYRCQIIPQNQTKRVKENLKKRQKSFLRPEGYSWGAMPRSAKGDPRRRSSTPRLAWCGYTGVTLDPALSSVVAGRCTASLNPARRSIRDPRCGPG